MSQQKPLPISEIPEKNMPDADDQFIIDTAEGPRKTKMERIYDRLESAYLGNIIPSSTIPTTESWYGTVLEAGTFNNVTPAITVDAADFDVENGIPNNEVRIIISDGVATKDVRRVKGSDYWTIQYEDIESGDKVIRKVTGYTGGSGTVPTSLSVNIGKYFASDGGFTADEELATNYRNVIRNDLSNSENFISFVDAAKREIASIDENGEYHSLKDKESLNEKIRNLQTLIYDNFGKEVIIGFADRAGRVPFYIDKNGVIVSNGERLTEKIVSPAIIKALRYEKAGDEISANLFLDVAENENKMPIAIETLVAKDGEDNSIQRIPAIEKLHDGRVIMMWQQIRKPNTGDGAGVRIMQCYIDYNLETGEITVADKRVFDEPPQWEDRLYAAMHPHIIKMPSGKLICIYNYNNNPNNGTVEQRILDVVMKTSMDDGLTWSNREIIMPAEGSSIPRNLSTGSTASTVLKKRGTNIGRLLVPTWGNGLGYVGVIYSDDEGLTWQKSTFQTVGFQGNECSIFEQQDGTLVMHIRVEGYYTLYYASSTDGGETWIFHGAKTGWRASNCSSSTIQWTNGLETQQKVIWSGLDNATNYSRYDFCIRVSYDDGLTYQKQFLPFSRQRMAGYSCLLKLTDDVLAVAWENGFNNNCNVFFNIYNLSKIFKNN